MRQDEIVTLKVIAKNLKKYCDLAKSCAGCPFHSNWYGCRIHWPCRWQLEEQNDQEKQ